MNNTLNLNGNRNVLNNISTNSENQKKTQTKVTKPSVKTASISINTGTIPKSTVKHTMANTPKNKLHISSVL